MEKKKILISAGPIPAKLDSVKYLTNMFKGGLALKTAYHLAKQPDFDVTLLMWKHADKALVPVNIHELVCISDVFEYYDWITAHANDFDAFVMAAAVANLTPVHPHENKFPSHKYKPGEEFDIKFMIAPRAIDAIKPLNPRACLIGYKLYDEPDDSKLIEIARHTLDDAKANLIFANRPHEAKTRKLAVLPDGTAFETSFGGHLELMCRAIRQQYFRTLVKPLNHKEQTDPGIREALATVKMYEQTFEHFGTVAVPVKNKTGMFATTSRGHIKDPVIVRSVDHTTGVVIASGKATLNAPTLAAMLRENPDEDYILVHRHFDDPLADSKIPDDRENLHQNYQFPGTTNEAEYAAHSLQTSPDGSVTLPGHGYIIRLPILPVDWNRYYDQFPPKYFSMHDDILRLIKWHKDQNLDTLEIGGNRRPIAQYSYDPYVKPDPGFGKSVSWTELTGWQWPLIASFNALNYLTFEELQAVLEHCDTFIANTFRNAPAEKIAEGEYAVLSKDKTGSIVRHGLRLKDDSLMRHQFHGYTRADFEAMGLSCYEYGKSFMLVYKSDTHAISINPKTGLTLDA